MLRLVASKRPGDASSAADDPPTPAAVEFDAVRLVRQGQPVLDELSCSLPVGRQLAVIGGNGAGKSALLRAIVDRPRLDHGGIRLFGGETGDPAVRRRIGCLPDRSQTQRWLHDGGSQEYGEGGSAIRAVELLGWFGTHVGMAWCPDEARDLAECHRLGGAWLDEDARRLSPGSVAVLGLLATVASDRELLLLDEPFIGLDAQARGQWAERLADLKQRQRTVMIATRKLAGIEPQTDQIVLLVDGCLSYSGPPAGLAGAGRPAGAEGPGAVSDLRRGRLARMHLQQTSQGGPAVDRQPGATGGRIVPFRRR